MSVRDHSIAVVQPTENHATDLNEDRYLRDIATLEAFYSSYEITTAPGGMEELEAEFWQDELAVWQPQTAEQYIFPSYGVVFQVVRVEDGCILLFWFENILYLINWTRVHI